MSHINNSSSRLIRLAWTLIVVLGFALAATLIWQSLDNWRQNPVDTTVSTNTIDQVTFPKIYVCPPKLTYTNLNQDILDFKDKFFTDDQIKEIENLIDENIEPINDFHKDNKWSFNAHVEENRLYNWYMGFSELVVDKLNTWVKTTSSHGSLGIPNFEEEYQEDKFELFIRKEFTLKILNLTSPTQKLILEIEADLKETYGGTESISMHFEEGITSIKK